MTDLPTSPDLQAEAERVFADVQRAVLVEDAKQVIAKALQAAVDGERDRCKDISGDFILSFPRGAEDLASSRVAEAIFDAISDEV